MPVFRMFVVGETERLGSSYCCVPVPCVTSIVWAQLLPIVCWKQADLKTNFSRLFERNYFPLFVESKQTWKPTFPARTDIFSLFKVWFPAISNHTQDHSLSSWMRSLSLASITLKNMFRDYNLVSVFTKPAVCTQPWSSQCFWQLKFKPVYL